MGFFWYCIGMALGISIGISSTKTKVKRRLREFVAARNLRLLDGAGAEVSVEDLASVVGKD